MMTIRTTLSLLLLTVQGTLCARVLGVFAHPVRSNALYTRSVMAAIAARGHQVIVYGPFAPSKPVPNMTYIEVYTEYRTPLVGDNAYEKFVNVFIKKSTFFDPMSVVALKKCDAFLKHSKVQDLIRSSEHFDLVVTLGGFGEESLLAFGHVFNAPTIVILPSGTWSTVNYGAGNSLSIAHMPDYFMFDFSNRMTFGERALNLAAAVVRKVRFHFHDLPDQYELIERHLPGLGIPPLDQLIHNVSLTLVNAHPTVTYPQPYTPNIVPIGGIQLDGHAEPLTPDIRKLMDESATGVVYFSLGTAVPVESMPVKLLQTFINVFKRLPQKVIWKITLNNDVILPNNVYVYKWVPQKSILAHPNCKLFITHGGQASQFETLRAGVPVVGIPFFSDQPYNIRKYEEFGVGEGLNLFTLTEETFLSEIQKVLKTSSYMENARRVSRIFQDVPVTPAETVGYWAEYVIRHRGAAHLRSAATRLYWHQRALLDVVAVTIIAALLTIAFIMYLLRTLIHLLLYFCKGKPVIKKYKSKTS